MSFLSAIESEIADLERKLHALRATRAAYLGVPTQVSRAPETTGEWRAGLSSRQERLEMRGRGTGLRAAKNTAAISAAKEFVRRQGRATPTQEIYDYLVSEGIEISGKQPRNTLSAMLSNSMEFQSIDRKGWRLTSPAHEGTEVTGAGRFETPAPATSSDPRSTSGGHPLALSPVKPWAGGGT
jgi:hypothetical protein